MAKTRHKKNEDTLLMALACGASIEAAAKRCQVHERTVYRRMEDHDFKAHLQELRTDIVRRACGMLTAASNEAVRTLLNLQKEATPPAVRLGAARAILEMGMKIREVVELETRMSELEALVKQQQAGPRGVYRPRGAIDRGRSSRNPYAMRPSPDWGQTMTLTKRIRSLEGRVPCRWRGRPVTLPLDRARGAAGQQINALPSVRCL